MGSYWNNHACAVVNTRDTPKVTRQHSSLKMPRKIAKTSTTRGKETCQKPPNQDKGDGAPPRGLHQTRQQNRSISRKRTREADEPTSKRPRKNPKETTNSRVTTRTRANGLVFHHLSSFIAAAESDEDLTEQPGHVGTM